MTPYLVSARKYRPTTFESVVGQSALTSTLKNAVVSGRIASSYLFCGTRGVGKTTCARIFAKTINCEHLTADGNPCNECDSCKAFNAGTSLNIIELDAASNNGVDAMRALTEQVRVPPVQGRYKVFIVDEVHMLSTQAFNAFLKTLEEPPSYVVFVLATTEKQKIIPTILSRCQIYDFHRISIPDIIKQLQYVASQENISVEPAALNVIARKADGAMRDALSIFDQVAASSMGNVTYASTIENLNILDFEYYNRLVEAFLTGNVPESLLIYKEIREKGFDSQFFINGLASHFRDLMVAQNPSTIVLLEASEESRNAIASIAAKCSPSFLYRAMDLCNQADLNYRTASNKQFLVELTLIKLCQLLSPSPDSGAGEGRQLRPISTSDSAPQAGVLKDARPEYVSQPKQSPVNPAPKPKPAVNSAPPVSSKPSGLGRLRAPGLSINRKPMAAVHEQSDSVADARSVRNSPFSDQQFADVWKQFIETHPTEHLLINAMRVTHPVRSDGGTRFSATVESEAIRDSIHQSMPELLAYLRETLSNDSVEVDVILNKSQASVTSLTDSEVYALMRKNHPYLNVVIDDLHLTLV